VISAWPVSAWRERGRRVCRWDRAVSRGACCGAAVVRAERRAGSLAGGPGARRGAGSCWAERSEGGTGDAGERAARLRQQLRWAARVGAGPGREKAASRWREGKEVRGLGCWASAGEEGSWARVGFSWARLVGPSVGFGLGFQGRLGWAWVEFGFGWVLVSSFLFYSISKTNTQILIEFKLSTQTKRTMHQHECNSKFLNLDKF
jgi:hypothetical protein